MKPAAFSLGLFWVALASLFVGSVGHTAEAKGPKTVVIETLIDGPSELRVKKDGIYWINGGNAKPGRHDGGGGRYDDLTGLFGVPNIPGVGISFGVDRIYDVMEELKLFPADVHVGTQVLFFNLGEKESGRSFELMQQLRQKGVRSELFHETAKFDKQFKYAEKKNIPHIIIIGERSWQKTPAI